MSNRDSGNGIRYIYTDNAHYSAIADAIRERLGSADNFLPSEMANAIYEIPANKQDTIKLLLDITGDASYMFARLTPTMLGLVLNPVSGIYTTENAKNFYHAFEDSEIASTLSIDTSNAVNCEGMFIQCPLTSARLSLPEAITAKEMFYRCWMLETATILASLKLQDATSMFENCFKLTALPTVNTRNVTNMSCMFLGALSTSFGGHGDVHYDDKYVTENVLNMERMFAATNRLITCHMSDTSKVTSFYRTFYGSDGLQSVALDETSSAIDMSYMFTDCVDLETVTLPYTSSATTMKGMFQGAGVNAQLTVSLPTVNYVEDMSYMFANTKNVAVSLTNSLRVTDMSHMFEDAIITTISGANINTSSATTMEAMFAGATGQSVSFNALDTVNDTQVMFTGAEIDSISIVSIGTSGNLVNMQAMFSNCRTLTMPQVSFRNAYNINSIFANLGRIGYTNQLTTISMIIDNAVMANGAFHDSHNLETVALNNAGKLQEIYSLCEGCLDLQSATITNVTQNNPHGSLINMGRAFYNCQNLTNVYIEDTYYVQYMDWAFWQCFSLTEIPAFDCRNVTTFSHAFDSCIALQAVKITNINASLDISSSTLFNNAALMEVITNLVQQDGRTRILTMGSTNKSKLSLQDIAVATAKGWTIE